MKIYIYLLLITYTHLCFAQSEPRSAYYDAIYLEQIIKGNKGKFMNSDPKGEVDKVLEYYFGKYNDADLKILMKKNPFLKNYYLPSDGATADNKFSITGILLPKSSSSIGSIPVTNFVDGLAKFLVERSKEELNVTFFRKFQEFMKEYPEVKVIFPTTYEFIGQIYSYQYNAMLPALKSAFHKDMSSFSNNLIKLRELTIDKCEGKSKCESRIKKMNEFLNENPKGRAIIGSLIVADNMIKGENAAEIVNNLANDPVFTNYPKENLSNVMQFVNLISESLRSQDEDRVWITKEQINNLVKDEITFKIYLGLLYALDQKNSNPIKITLNDNIVSLKNILDELAKDQQWNTHKDKFIKSFKEMANEASNVSNNAINISTSKLNNEQSSILIYAAYASSVSEFLKKSTSFLESTGYLNGSIIKLSEYTSSFTSVIDNAVNACYDLKSQNYSALVLHSSLILSDLLNDKEYIFKNNYVKYGTFMANIIEAKNSDEVKIAIEAAVLPVGSSSLKRETDVNIALNAYIGGYGGIENMQSLSINKSAFSAGLTAPVGIAFSRGKLFSSDTSNTKGGKSITLFIPLIDIGSLASYRINDSSTNIASDIELRNIISPGLYFYYGLGKCPISIGIGGQLGPELRGITEGTPKVDNANIYIRYGLNIVVDIPLLNFYTNSK